MGSKHSIPILNLDMAKLKSSNIGHLVMNLDHDVAFFLVIQ